MHTPAAAFKRSNGPRDASIVLVGEAFGENENICGVPFVGESGLLLANLCFEAELVSEPPPDRLEYSNIILMEWWARQPLLVTNVFAFRPAANSLSTLCGKKAQVSSSYWRQPLGKGGYVLEEYLGELDRLREELQAHDRTCIVALGATATWALMNQPKIGTVRGVATKATALCPEIKVLPTYHPAGILRNYPWRAVALADLTKVAKREGGFSEVRRPERQCLINPSLQNVRDFFAKPALGYSVDVETFKGYISYVGFATSKERSICIPFLDRSKPGYSYWSREEELLVWQIVRAVMENPKVEKTGQNFIYDLQYFFKHRIRVRGCAEDTMLLAHALMPEMQKSLGFLGSIYTNEAAWKLWHGRQQEELKRDE